MVPSASIAVGLLRRGPQITDLIGGKVMHISLNDTLSHYSLPQNGSRPLSRPAHAHLGRGVRATEVRMGDD